MATPNPEPTLTRLDVLAEWMGFTLAYRTGGGDVTCPVVWLEQDGTHTIVARLGDSPRPWNPLGNADDDYDVLQRARDVWGHSDAASGSASTPEWDAFERAAAKLCHIQRDVQHVTQGTIGLMARIVPRGVWSRAVLAVLETKGDFQ